MWLCYIATKLYALGDIYRNFTADHMALAQQLIECNSEENKGSLDIITLENLRVAAKIKAASENLFNFSTYTELEAAKRLYQFNPNFTEDDLKIAVRTFKRVSRRFSQEDFTQEKNLVNSQPNEWANGDQTARLKVLFDQILNKGRDNKLPGLKRDQDSLIVFALKLLRKGDVTIPDDLKNGALNNNIMILENADLDKGEKILQKAFEISNYVKNQGLERKNAVKFYKFTAALKPVEENMGLQAIDKRASLFKSLKPLVSNTVFDEAIDVLVALFKDGRTLPLDHTEWPDFNQHNYSFDNFVRNTLLSMRTQVERSLSTVLNTLNISENLGIFTEVNISAVTAKIRDLGNQYKVLNEAWDGEDQEVERELDEVGEKLELWGKVIPTALAPLLEHTLETSDVSRLRKLNHVIGEYKVQATQHDTNQRNLYGNHEPLVAISDTFSTVTQKIRDRLNIFDQEAQRTLNLRKKINYARLCNDPFLTLFRAPDAKLKTIVDNFSNLQDEVASGTFRR